LPCFLRLCSTLCARTSRRSSFAHASPSTDSRLRMASAPSCLLAL
jgi:hypothetical protein